VIGLDIIYLVIETLISTGSKLRWCCCRRSHWPRRRLFITHGRSPASVLTQRSSLEPTQYVII